MLMGWLVMAVIMMALYGVQQRRQDAGIADVGWAAGVGALAIFYALAADGYPLRRTVLALLAGFWGFRLALYLLFNRVLRGPEDGRYRMLRVRWGGRAPLYFFLFFQMQALWAILFSIPFLAVAYHPKPAWSLFDTAGVFLWLIAVVGESTADAQLAHFRAQPENRGRTCTQGLWHYSRHPNYFFEFLHWWTYVLLGAGAPYGWVTLLGPLTMLLFLYKITGIPYTEKQALASRGEDYRQYQQTTSSLIPWFPKKGKQ
jgi:steroid 5-alpha reductase family enzyme